MAAKWTITRCYRLKLHVNCGYVRNVIASELSFRTSSACWDVSILFRRKSRRNKGRKLGKCMNLVSTVLQLPWGKKLQCLTHLLYILIDQSRFEVVLKLAQHFQFSLGKEICLHDVMTLFESWDCMVLKTSLYIVLVSCLSGKFIAGRWRICGFL